MKLSTLKKLCLVAFICLATTNANSQTTAIPDANFEQALIRLGIDSDATVNGEILTSDAQSVTTLNISDSGIGDFTGIEAFTNLEELYCRTHSATSLDLSANTALRILNCSNSLSRSLTELNISSCVFLEELYCSHNSLKDLDLRANTSLRVLDCNMAQVRNLYISTCRLLTEVNLHGNYIDNHDIDFSNHLSLVKFIATLTSAWFSVLDVTQNTFLEELALPGTFTEAFLPEGGNLKTLKIAKNFTSITTLNVPNLPNLVELSIIDVTIRSGSLDVRKAPNLKILELVENRLTSVNIEGLTKLEELNLSKNELSEVTISSPELVTLNLSENQITSLDVSNCPLLYDCRVNDNKMYSLDFSNNTNLGTLYVENNSLSALNITNLNYSHLSLNGLNNPLLEIVCVDDPATFRSSGRFDAGTLFSADCSELKTSYYIPDANFEQKLIDDGIDNSSTTPDNRLYEADTEPITMLNISNSSIADATGLEAFKNITWLSCANNELTSLDISKNTLLTTLVANGNNLTTLETTNNLNLENLELLLNTIDNIELSHLTELKKISLNGNPIKFIDVSANRNLSTVDFRNTKIETLNLSSNAKLTSVNLQNLASIKSLNIKNGSNTGITLFDTRNTTNLFCIQVDDPAYSQANWTSINSTNYFVSEECNVRLTAKAFLNGASNESTLMRDDLRAKMLIPTQSPYDETTCEASVFNTTGNNAIVDWVLVKLTDESDTSNVVYEQSALLQRDGDIVAPDGVSSLNLATNSKEYNVIVYHRNHIPIATNKPTLLSSTPVMIDFTNPTNVLGETNALTPINTTSIYAMFSGNVDSNNTIQNEDITTTKSSLGVAGYNLNDVNMDGEVQTTDIRLIQLLLGKTIQF